MSGPKRSRSGEGHPIGLGHRVYGPLRHGVPPPWASSWGEDVRGVWVGFEVDHLEHLLRWVPYDGGFWYSKEPFSGSYTPWGADAFVRQLTDTLSLELHLPTPQEHDLARAYDDEYGGRAFRFGPDEQAEGVLRIASRWTEW